MHFFCTLIASYYHMVFKFICHKVAIKSDDSVCRGELSSSQMENIP